ncbi:MAG: hypothetical protein ACRD6B_24325, partial [Bryobacteraceae bacterium]
LRTTIDKTRLLAGSSELLRSDRSVGVTIAKDMSGRQCLIWRLHLHIAMALGDVRHSAEGVGIGEGCTDSPAPFVREPVPKCRHNKDKKNKSNIAHFINNKNLNLWLDVMHFPC